MSRMHDRLSLTLTELVNDQINKALKNHATTLEDRVLNAVRSRSVTPAPHVIDTQVKSRCSRFCPPLILFPDALGADPAAFAQQPDRGRLPAGADRFRPLASSVRVREGQLERDIRQGGEGAVPARRSQPDTAVGSRPVKEHRSKTRVSIFKSVVLAPSGLLFNFELCCSSRILRAAESGLR